MSDYAFNYQVIKHEVSSISYIDYRDCLVKEAYMVAKNGTNVWVAYVDGEVRKTDARMLCNVVSELLGQCNVVAAGMFLCNPCDCRGWRRNIIDPKPLGDGSFILENTTIRREARFIRVVSGRHKWDLQTRFSFYRTESGGVWVFDARHPFQEHCAVFLYEDHVESLRTGRKSRYYTARELMLGENGFLKG